MSRKLLVRIVLPMALLVILAGVVAARRGFALPILMSLGGIVMLLALLFSVALYIWGEWGHGISSMNWGDLIIGIYILYFGGSAFVIGLILFVAGSFM